MRLIARRIVNREGANKSPKDLVIVLSAPGLSFVLSKSTLLDFTSNQPGCDPLYLVTSPSLSLQISLFDFYFFSVKSRLQHKRVSVTPTFISRFRGTQSAVSTALTVATRGTSSPTMCATFAAAAVASRSKID